MESVAEGNTATVERTAHQLRAAMDALHESMDLMRQERKELAKRQQEAEEELRDIGVGVERLPDLQHEVRDISRRIDHLKRYEMDLDAQDQLLRVEAEQRFGAERFIEMTG
jgi:uncharacterized protein YoxC